MDRALLQRQRDRLKIATKSESTAEGIGRLHTLRNDQTKNIRRLQPPARERHLRRSRASPCAVKALQAERCGGRISALLLLLRLLLEFLERVFQRVEQPRDARSRHEDAARYGRARKEGCDEIETELAGRVTDHHGIGVVAGKDVVLEFELLVEILCGNGRLGRRRRLSGRVCLVGGVRGVGRAIRPRRHDRLSEFRLVVVQIIGEGGDELRDDTGRENDARRDLLRLGHPQQKIEDEFMSPLHHDGAGAKDAPCHPLRHEGAHLRMLNLFAIGALLIRRPGSVERIIRRSCVCHRGSTRRAVSNWDSPGEKTRLWVLHGVGRTRLRTSVSMEPNAVSCR